MNRPLTSLVALGLLCAVAQSSTAGEPAFGFEREVIAPDIGRQSLVAFELDAHVYAHTREGLPDVQLRTADGQLTASLMRLVNRTVKRSERRNWHPQHVSVQPLRGDSQLGLEITVRLADDEPQPAGVRFVTPLRNFQQRVQVLSSVDGDNWQPLGDGSLVFDYSSYIDFRNVEIPLPATTHRWVRLVIDDVTVEQESRLMDLTRRIRNGREQSRDETTTIDRVPFRIDRLEFWNIESREFAGQPKRKAYPPLDFEVREDSETQHTELLIAMRTEPLSRFQLQTSSRNFSRSARLEVALPGSPDRWRVLANTKLTQLDFQSIQREKLNIDFPVTRSTTYRIIIDNGDSQPLDIASVEASGQVYQMLFLAEPSQTYELHYGSETATPPDMDTAILNELISKKFDPQIASLGETLATDRLAAMPTWSARLTSPWTLVPIIAVLVGVLAWGLYQATKRLDAMESSETSP